MPAKIRTAIFAEPSPAGMVSNRRPADTASACDLECRYSRATARRRLSPHPGEAELRPLGQATTLWTPSLRTVMLRLCSIGTYRTYSDLAKAQADFS
jgi:hypothetical protein